MTDKWVSMNDKVNKRIKKKNLKNYQVNKKLMQFAKPKAIFMHCLPAYRNKEVSSDVLEGSQSVVFDEAENRLHAQKAIMHFCIT